MRFDEFYKKASVLMEAPYHYSGDYEEGQRKLEVGSRLSNTQLEKNRFVYIGSLDAFDKEIKLYTDGYGYSMAIMGYIPVDEKYNDRIFGISLRKTYVQDIGDVWTVTNVQTDKSFRMGGLATTLYAFIVQHMGVILSDTHQYEGAVRLWKALANHASGFGLKVSVLNSQTNEIKEYDGSNIPDNQIWGTDENYHPNIRLLMQKA